MLMFTKNLLKFSNGHVHSVLRLILNTWVQFYSTELKEFKHILIFFVFNVFIRYVCLLCMVEDSKLGKENNFKLQYSAIFNK